ncbi:DUF2254 domain-containing protein [Flavobacterium sp. Arc3]|jgi:uncharacterized membrane protein|uniref:DUF2254 domain-containing protein n=1 Tax=unclassified Flavobacterium TaxID=196869 RepID=UPI00352EDA69
MNENVLFAIKRLKEKLWFRPLIFCVLSIIAALIAQVADSTGLHELVPKINKDSLESLLNNISASMLVISIFAVGSMISAFSAASNTATPRSFKLIIADDVSKNALSVFIGSFIYSIVATVALKNGYYGIAGNFTLFVFTLLFFALVILTFLRWVERISRLGRMGHTIKLVENATANAIENRLASPTLYGLAINPHQEQGIAVYSQITGYVQQLYISKLQEIAEKLDAIITINALPGSFSSIDKPLFYISLKKSTTTETDYNEMRKAFIIGDMRYFDEDPRFGLITLSEIASRALSPAVNDPGTAIQIISSYVRLFTLWAEPVHSKKEEKNRYDRISVPELAISDLFEDAFRPIARDGAGNIEVMIRLQKAFSTLYSIDNPAIKIAALHNSYQAFERAEREMKFNGDLSLLKNESLFTQQL